MSSFLKSSYINELSKYSVRLDRNLAFFKEPYKGSYFSWLAFISSNHIELANKISFISFPTPCIVYNHYSHHNYSFYSLKDLESFKSQLKILYHQFKSAIIQAKLYSLKEDF